MIFHLHTFSKRYPPVECSLFVLHEPALKGLPYEGASGKTLYRGTAAAIILPDSRFWVGVCLCSPQDQFIKAVGRAKAIGRAYQSIRTGVDAVGNVTLIEDRTDKVTLGSPEFLRDRLLAAIDTMKREKGIV